MSNLDNLILLTATYRGSNLPMVAKSIDQALLPYNKSIFKIHWILCIDITHWQCYSSVDTMVNMLKMHYKGININAVEIETRGDKTLGGDLYNKPLEDYVRNNAIENPWVYILDDDNILHPSLIKYVIKASELYPDKEIIWLTNMQRSGRIDGVVSEDYAMQYTKSGTMFMNFPDPSTAVYRYDLLSRYGLYATGGHSDYDLRTFIPMIGENLDKCVFSKDLDPEMKYPHQVQKVHAYHDGLRTEDEFNNDFRSFEMDQVEVCNFRVQSLENRYPTQYHVPPELGEMILHMIKVYYDQHNLTGHISRGE